MYRIFSNVDFDLPLVDSDNRTHALTARAVLDFRHVTVSVMRAKDLGYITVLDVPDERPNWYARPEDEIVDQLPNRIPTLSVAAGARSPVPRPTEPLVIYSPVTRSFLQWTDGAWAPFSQSATSPESPDMPQPQTLLLDEVSDGLMYVGEAAPGSATADPVWRIKRVTTEADGDTQIKWADAAQYTAVWDNRANLEYA